MTVGDSITLSCQILAGTPTPNVIWIRRDGKPIAGSVKKTYDGRDLISIDYHIPNLKLEDAGEYECRAWNKVGRARLTAAILVLKPPIVHISPNTQELTITEGDEFRLKCYAEGVPSPHVYWTRETDQPIVMKSHRMKRDAKSFRAHIPAKSLIRKYKASPRDGGMYVCHAKNKAGEDNKFVIVRIEPKRNEIGECV